MRINRFSLLSLLLLVLLVVLLVGCFPFGRKLNMDRIAVIDGYVISYASFDSAAKAQRISSSRDPAKDMEKKQQLLNELIGDLRRIDALKLRM